MMTPACLVMLSVLKAHPQMKHSYPWAERRVCAIAYLMQTEGGRYCPPINYLAPGAPLYSQKVREAWHMTNDPREMVWRSRPDTACLARLAAQFGAALDRAHSLYKAR